MPVLRAKSPRWEGGRCYPKVCWSAVTRATHWGVSRRSAAPETHSVRAARSAKVAETFNGFPVDSDQSVVTSRLGGDSAANGCSRAMGVSRAPSAHGHHQGGVHAAGPLPTRLLPRGLQQQQHRQPRHQTSTPRSATPSRTSGNPSAGKDLSNGGGFRTPGTKLRFFSRNIAAAPPLVACDDHHCDVDDLCDASSASDCSSASDAQSSSGGHSVRDSCSGSDDDGACSGTCCIPAGDAPCCLLPYAHTAAGAKIITSAIAVPSADARYCGYGVCRNENDTGIAKMPLRGRGDEDVPTAACMGALISRVNGLGARDGGAGQAATPNGHYDTQVLDRCDGEARSPRHLRAENKQSAYVGEDACDRNTSQRGIVCRIGHDQDSDPTPMVRQDTFTIERGQGGVSPRGDGGISLPMLSRPLCPSPAPTPSLATLRPRAGQSGTSNGSKLRPPATHFRDAARTAPARSNGVASAPYSRAMPQPRAALAASRGGRSRGGTENRDCRVEESLGGGNNTPPWEPHHVAKGPRGSGNTKRGAPYTRSSVSSDEHDHQAAAGQQKEDPPHQPTHRGRRAMKITLREEPTKKNTNLTTPASRTRSGSRSSGGSSPATIHGRAPHKTATVTPAPNKVTPKSGSLNRFGFRNSAQVKSGDSTDSVNSILSDAQTISDSNSNIFELCEEENENLKSTKKNSETDLCDNNDIHVQNRLSLSNTKVNKTPTPYSTPRGTPNLQSGRITAFTRQLPKPQVVTVKSVSPKPQTPLSYSPKPYTPKPHSPKTQSPLVRDRTKSPSIRSLSNTPSKAPLEQTPKAKQFLSNSQRIPRVSRDSESSTRSGTEADSGLGSSSESDKIRGEGETDTLGSSNVESTEDMSDVWLRGKRTHFDPVKRRSGNMEVHFNGTGEFELKRRSLECKESVPSEPQLSSIKPEVLPEKKSDPSKEKREGTITYSMARQKFAPYSRGRIGYGYQGAAGRGGGEGASSNNSSNSSTNVTKIPGSSGLVRNRVAMLEKTPTKTTPQPPVRRSSLKKPVIRPTSLEKTPILVMPVTEKTVELSKPVCRRLEYSECKNVKSDAQNETSSEIQQGINPKLSTSHPKAEDILIVGSIEVETHTDNNIILESENHGSYYENSYEKAPLIVKEVPLKHSPDNNKTNENKAANDVIEKEKLHVVTFDGDSSEYLSETTNDYTDSSLSERVEDSCETGEMVNGHYLQSPDEFGMKILTPQSESSFEILESLSETVELSTEEARDDYSLTEADISESKATILEVKRQESTEGMATSTATSTASEGRASTEELSKPPLKPKPKLPSVSPEKLTKPNEATKPLCIPTEAPVAKHESSQKSPVGSPVDKKKPVGMGMTLVKSTDMKSSVDSSIDSPKSTTGNPMVESSDRSTLSGKCTPTLNSGRGDLDQDFLIDDEIADQPGLMFGGSTMASSFFTDDGIFDDLTSTSPSHVPLKSAAIGPGRSRANSVDTTSSLGADDLMLDFDIEEGKAGGSSNRSSNSSSLSVGLPGSLTGARPKKMHLRITIPGRRYDEEVLSPDASEIFSEWTAMMAEVGSSVAERCVSRDGSSGGGRTSRPRLNSSSDVSSPDPRRPTVLRPPRQGGISEGEGGGVCIDRTSYHYMCQDVTALKTMLLRLRRVLQAADTINPFDANLRNSLYLSLASSDSPGGCGINGDKDSLTPSVIELSQENIDLRRQVVLLQQQLEERDRTIRLLQQQLAQSLASQKTTCISTDAEAPTNTVNAATQTERSSRPTLTGSSLSRAASIDDGLGPTVSRYTFSEGEGDCMGRGRSTSAPEHRQPRAASQPPALLNRHPTQS
ncbi:uncharacterized protein LOC122246737 isoform X4 [Penaeus japonicus]|uniref:uncharacterized protein LOC122246737 isoform X4 n=1 Tax=Penaeus japonicus TaxID=27405 RepID=UPI001C70B5C2|nr:uncharacterized protein LOC122246737 isoform X4 [Penaeus japonicus]